MKATLLITLVLTLAACAQAPIDPAPRTPPTPESESPPTMAPVLAPPVEQEVLVPPGPTTNDIMGASPARAQALLGVPDLVRWEGSAQVHQFRLQPCVMDVVFYEIAENQGFQARYLSARTSSGQDMDVQTCLDGVTSLDALQN